VFRKSEDRFPRRETSNKPLLEVEWIPLGYAQAIECDASGRFPLVVICCRHSGSSAERSPDGGPTSIAEKRRPINSFRLLDVMDFAFSHAGPQEETEGRS